MMAVLLRMDLEVRERGGMAWRYIDEMGEGGQRHCSRGFL